MRYQITCINKTNRQSAHEKISHAGGIYDGIRWKKTQEQIVSDIESYNHSYFVRANYTEAEVIVVKTQWGTKYIKTANDGEMPNNLLSLPECP